VAQVLLFGRLADVAGWRSRASDAVTLSALRRELAAADPALGAALAAPGVQAAVDKRVVRTDVNLSSSSEVAFLPPMSGG
jgi:molybdopterin synthase sulfur carrier subunit